MSQPFGDTHVWRGMRARLLVAACLLAPVLAQPAMAANGVRKSISTRPYVISGHDERGLLRQMRRLGPRVGGKPALARSSMKARYHARMRQGRNGCRISSFQARVHYIVILPKVRNPRALSAAARKRWRHFHRRLRTHEARHIAIWDKCLQQVRRTLPKLRARNCTALKRKLRARYHAIMQACRKKHDAFDAHEQHVATSLPFIRAAYAPDSHRKARKRKRPR